MLGMTEPFIAIPSAVLVILSGSLVILNASLVILSASLVILSAILLILSASLVILSAVEGSLLPTLQSCRQILRFALLWRDDIFWALAGLQTWGSGGIVNLRF